MTEPEPSSTGITVLPNTFVSKKLRQLIENPLFGTPFALTGGDGAVYAHQAAA
jgi:hypothetical protein